MLGDEGPAGTRDLAPHQALLGLLAALHLAVGLIYSVVIPPWEGFDEVSHFAYVRSVAQDHRPPPRSAAVIEGDESAQPPLYYLLAGLLVTPIDLRHGPNPVPNDFGPSPEGGWNVVLHLDDERWPWHGTVLALHLARGLSALLGAGVVVASYALARELWPQRPGLALLAASLVAFQPAFLALGALVNNDALAILLSTVAFWQLARVARGSVASLWALPPLVALGLLTKITTAILLPLTAAVLLAAAWHTPAGGRRRTLLLWAAGWALACVALAALARQSERLRLSQLGATAGGSGQSGTPALPVEPFGSWRWFVEMGRAASYVFSTFWGSAGTGLLGLGGAVYWFYAGACLVALMGCLAAWRRGWLRAGDGQRLALMLLFALSAFLLPIVRLRAHWELGVLHGRFALVGLAPLATALAYGLVQAWRFTLRRVVRSLKLECSRWRALPGAALVALAAALALVAPFVSIAPVFARPSAPTPAVLARIQHPLRVDFDESIRLLGYDLLTPEVPSGGVASLALYWQCLRPVSVNALASVHVLAADMETVGRSESHPDHGRFPTSLWRPGNVLREVRHVPLERHAAAPAPARLGISLYWRDGGLHFLTYNIPGKGRGTTYLLPDLLRLTGGPDRPNPDLTYMEPRPVFDNGIALDSFGLSPPSLRPGGQLQVRLRWRSLRPSPRDLTVFVHLLDRRGQVVAQGDGQPGAGAFPTSGWLPAALMPDAHLVRLPDSLPNGPYRLSVGWYDARDGQKLPLTGLPGDAVLLATGLTAS